jgi:hypothetical protein
MESVNNFPGFSIYSQALQGNGEIWYTSFCIIEVVTNAGLTRAGLELPFNVEIYLKYHYFEPYSQTSIKQKLVLCDLNLNFSFKIYINKVGLSLLRFWGWKSLFY